MTKSATKKQIGGKKDKFPPNLYLACFGNRLSFWKGGKEYDFRGKLL